MRAFLWEFFVFGLKEARSCLFAGLFFGLLFLSRHIPLFGLPRYDFLCIAAVAVQILLLAFRLETKDEALTLCAFHALGLALELFKTAPAIGSWSYPEYGLLKIGTVPLYSGFMYAAVASYMCQAWRILDLGLERYPPYVLSVPLSAAVYLNFFTEHFIPDLRWFLAAAVAVVFWRTRVRFRVTDRTRRMPLLLSFALIGLFVWVAEDISTFFGAWVYPDQRAGWQIVSAGKISSWVLLVIVSFLIVADLKHMREARRPRPADGRSRRRPCGANRNIPASRAAGAAPPVSREPASSSWRGAVLALLKRDRTRQTFGAATRTTSPPAVAVSSSRVRGL